MQALNKTILEELAKEELTVRFFMNAENKQMVAVIIDQLGKHGLQAQGPDKHLALENLHAAWSKPAAKPTSKKKTSKKKSAPKTAPIEADAPDVDTAVIADVIGGGDDDG